MLNLNCMMLGSEEPKKLADFYGKVLQKEPDMKEGGFVGYLAGQCFLNIGPHDKVSGKNSNPERNIIFLETENVEDEFKRISQIEGASVIAEPYSPGGGSFQLATIADPDGNYFQLASPWDAE